MVNEILNMNNISNCYYSISKSIETIYNKITNIAFSVFKFIWEEFKKDFSLLKRDVHYFLSHCRPLQINFNDSSIGILGLLSLIGITLLLNR